MTSVFRHFSAGLRLLFGFCMWLSVTMQGAMSMEPRDLLVYRHGNESQRWESGDFFGAPSHLSWHRVDVVTGFLLNTGLSVKGLMLSCGFWRRRQKPRQENRATSWSLVEFADRQLARGHCRADISHPTTPVVGAAPTGFQIPLRIHPRRQPTCQN